MMKLSPFILVATLIAGAPAFAQSAGTTPSAGSPSAGSTGMTSSGSATGVNSLTGTTTGTGVGVTNNAAPVIRTRPVRGLNGGMSTGPRRMR